jgi:hypothetical protein
VLTLQANGDGKLKWYADASFAAHPDYKSHTGAIMTMGKGSIDKSKAEDEFAEFY